MRRLFENHIHLISEKISHILEDNQINSLLIHSGSLEYRFLDDLAYPFRINPIFNYLVPLGNVHDCFIYFEKNKKPILYYYRPVDYWHEMVAIPSGFWVDSFTIKVVTTTKDALNDLKLEQSVFIGQSASNFSEYCFKDVNPSELINQLHFIRSEKTNYELACLREANKIAARAHLIAEKAFRNGKSEFEINLAYLQAAKINENESPYNNIIALNENAAILHYTRYKHDVPEQFSFLIDAGVSFNGYASDITRAYSFRNDEWAEICQQFHKKQLDLIQTIKLDSVYAENHITSLKIVAEILHDFNFVNLSSDEIIEKKIATSFYPHGVGHFLGLQVHDVAGFQRKSRGGRIPPPKTHPALRLTRKIKARHVFTIEPGMYFIDSLLAKLENSKQSKFVNWSKVNQFRKYGGIRIEDNICIHETHSENMTRDAFKMVGLNETF